MERCDGSFSGINRTFAFTREEGEAPPPWEGFQTSWEDNESITEHGEIESNKQDSVALEVAPPAPHIITESKTKNNLKGLRIDVPTGSRQELKPLTSPKSVMSPHVNRKDTFWALTRSHHHLRQKTLQGIDKVVTEMEKAIIGPAACEPIDVPGETKNATLESSTSSAHDDDSNYHSGGDPKVRLPALGIHETVWIDAMGPSREEMTAIAEVLLLNNLTLEDLTTGNTPDKIEIVGDYIFAVISFQKEGEPQKCRVAIVMMERLIFTVHAGSTWVVKEAVTRLHIMRLTVLTSEVVFYAILDAIVDSIATSVILFQDEVDAIDESVLSITEEDRSDVLRRLTKARRTVGVLRHVAISKDAIAKTVLSQQFARCFLLRQNYRDVVDNLTQSLARIDTARDVISQANNNVTSILSMSIAEHANDTNDFMKGLSMVGGVLMPLNLLCSAFGMNIRVPYMADQANGQNTDAWWVMCGCAAGYCVLCLCWFYASHLRKSRKLAKKEEEAKEP